MARGEVTRLLNAHASGKGDAINELLPIVYEELRRIAYRRLQRERPDHTFGATALVHEAYLELVDLDRIDWQGRRHFFAVASRVMRNVLVDYAARRGTLKRGGDRLKVPLESEKVRADYDLSRLIAVHYALSRLESIDERQVRVVECRFFGGLTVEETAEALGVSVATVGRDWSMARAWLNRELSA